MATKNVVFTHEGRSHQITQADDKAVRDVMTAQAGVTDRYIKIEPAISAAFSAPACYQKGTDEREDVLAYLQSRHPDMPIYEKLSAQRDAAKAKGDPTLAYRISLDAAATMKKITSDVANALRAMKLYYEAGREGKRAERQAQSPRAIAEACRTKLGKIADDTDWPAADIKLAKALVAAITSVLGDSPSLAVAPKAERPERANGKVVEIDPAQYTAAQEAVGVAAV